MANYRIGVSQPSAALELRSFFVDQKETQERFKQKKMGIRLHIVSLNL